MLTMVGTGDAHADRGIVIIESAGWGLTTETVIDSVEEVGAGSSFLEGGGGIIPWFPAGFEATGRDTAAESGVGAGRFFGRDFLSGLLVLSGSGTKAGVETGAGVGTGVGG